MLFPYFLEPIISLQKELTHNISLYQIQSGQNKDCMLLY